MHKKKWSEDHLQWHNVEILFSVVNSSESWLQLDVSISVLWSSSGEVVFKLGLHISTWKFVS